MWSGCSPWRPGAQGSPGLPPPSLTALSCSVIRLKCRKRNLERGLQDVCTAAWGRGGAARLDGWWLWEGRECHLPTSGPTCLTCRWAAIPCPLSERAETTGAGAHLQGFKSPRRPGARAGLPRGRAWKALSASLRLPPVTPMPRGPACHPGPGPRRHLHRSGRDSPPGRDSCA